ncbi:PfkB family carbohydrate kinase [Aeromonas jandaei]
MPKEKYIVTIGSINMDIAGYPHSALIYSDSNPGKIQCTPGGVGRNIAHNLALLNKESWLLSVVGDDSYGQSLLDQTAQVGVHVDKCLALSGKNTSSYLSLLDEQGEMLVALNDMSIIEHITPDFLQPHKEFIKNSEVIITDCGMNEPILSWLIENAGSTPIFVDPASSCKCTRIKHHLAHIHTLKPNKLEAETLSGISIEKTNDVRKVADWFHCNGLQRLIISMGRDGAYYSEKNGEYGWSPALKTHVVNVTGAGDAMMAGLAACWVDGVSFAHAVRFAQGCSSLTLSCEFTNNPSLSYKNINQLLMEKNYV